MDLAKYRTLFVNESREYLQGMSDRILRLSDSPSQEGLEWLFRAAHSIKGMSASLGYGPLTNLTHRMEDIFDAFKKGTLSFDQNLQTLLLHGLDLIESMLNEVERGEPIATATNTLEAALKKSISRVSQAATASRFLYKLEWTLNSDETQAAELILRRLEEFGRISRLNPSREEIRAGNTQGSYTCYLVTSQAAIQLEEALRKFPELLHCSVTPVDPYSKSSPEAEAASFFESGDETVRLNSVRVETSKIDRIIEDIGELLIRHTQLQESQPESIEIGRLRALAQEIYASARELRMLPFETISSRFPRIVHDLSVKLGKKVKLQIEGAEMEIDKAILAEIADPLIHLLRNAMDHGIEAPLVRSSTGKAETGSITIAIKKKGDKLVVSMEDDGRGLDPQIIKSIAVENRLIAAGMADLLNVQETLLLITRSGFSTSATVSDVSGRGVGLDAVRGRIETMGGQLLIFSHPGKYTRFEMVLPFTLAVLPALLVRVGGRQLAVPLSRVNRVLLLARKDLHYTYGRAVYFEKDSTLYVEQLQNCICGTHIDFAEEFPAFVTQHQNREIAWGVDELTDEKEILLKLIGEPLNRIRIYSGATVASNGEVWPVLDMEQLYRERYE